MSVLAQHGKVAKALPCERLATHKLLVSDDALVSLELLATNLADKHMPNVLQNCVLVRCWQILESLDIDITRGTPSLYCVLSPQTDPIQEQPEFPHKQRLQNQVPANDHPSLRAP